MYELHLRRDTPPITLDEWIAAVERSRDVRLMTADWTIENPGTGETITIPRSDGDAEVHVASGRWVPILRFSTELGVVAMPARALDDPAIRTIVRDLARRLRGFVVGEEDERYDLDTGDPID